MLTKAISHEQRGELEALLRREAGHNVFYLSALREHGIVGLGREDGAWAVGAYCDDALTGVVTALRGTGGVYYAPGDDESLRALALVAQSKAKEGLLSLLSGHASQVDPLLPLLRDVQVGPADRCDFRTLLPGDLRLPDNVAGWGAPRLAGNADMERLIDFYDTGFYSLAKLPTRAAWRYRLSEQIAYRTMFLVEGRDGKIVSAAQSSAEAEGAAMLGGVATLGEYRGIGLSTLCVGALCEYLFREGMDSISLFYLKDNEAAGRVYNKLGFREAGEWLLVSLGLGTFFQPLLGMSSW